MKISTRFLFVFVTAISVSLAKAQSPSDTQAAVTPGSALAPQAASVRLFVYCSEASPQTLNSQLATDGATFDAASRTMYNRLIEFEKGTTKVIPSLAEYWEVSGDGKMITFYLRKNVDFHSTPYFTPTRKFNADDVIFSFQRMRDPNHPFHNVGGGKYPTFEAQQMERIVRNVVRVNDHAIRFELTRPEAPFLANLAMDFASILSKEYGDQLIAKNAKAEIDTKPIGTGPFVFEKYIKDEMIRYSANPTHFRGRPQIDQLVFSITPDPEKRVRKLRNGECDLVPEPPTDSFVDIRADPNLKLISQPGLNIAYLAMNLEKPPFDQFSVRKAIHMALDREKYIREVYGNNAQIAKNPVPPTMWSYARGTKDLSFAPQLAKEALKKAGFPDGYDTELWYADVSRPYNPNSKKMAELIKADLAVVGIRATLKELPWAEFLDRSRKGEPPLSLQGWTSDNGDPDNFLNNLLSCDSIPSGNNRARWCNRKFTFYVDRARVTTDIRTRTKYYEDAQKIFKDELPWVTLAHGTVFRAFRKNVEGYRISPFGVDYFGTVSLKDKNK